MNNVADMEKLNALNHTLADVENELLRRRVVQQDIEIDSAIDVINQMADAGHVEICPCGDEDGE